MRLLLASLLTVALVAHLAAKEEAFDPAIHETITEEDKALAKAADEAIARNFDNPGREYVNRLTSHPRTLWRQQLAGQKLAPKGSLAWGRKQVQGAIEGANRGPDWPRPPDVAFPRFKQAPTIDGKLDDPAWQQAWTWKRQYPYNQQDEGPAEVVFHGGWDETYLYFAFAVQDDDLIAPPQEQDGRVFFFDCVEIYVLPNFRTRAYWELDINPAGQYYDGLCAKLVKGWGASSDADEDIADLQIGTVVNGTLNQPDDTDQGYVVEVAIPFRELPGYRYAKPAAGQELHFMLAHFDKDEGKPMRPYTFVPILAWCHNIWNHSRMTLSP